MISSNGDASAETRRMVSAAAKEIERILARIPKTQWQETVELAGVPKPTPAPSQKTSDKTDDKILQDADETDIEMLGRLSMEAMKRGLKARTPNAQVLRVFKDWQREQAGLKQITEGVVINIVPAEVPDEMSPMLVSMMKELRDLATASNL